MKIKLNLRLQTTITLLVCGVSISCLLVTNYFVHKNVEETIFEHIEEKAKGISRVAAISPIFIDGLSGKESDETIQKYAEKMRKAAQVPFIVVLDMNGIRKSHPIPSKIGEKYVGGDAGEVYKGHEHTSMARGTLGESLRYFTPVYSKDGKQIGAILVGVLLDDVQRKVWKSIRVIFISMILGLIVGIIGAVLLARKVKGILFGMEPAEVANLLKQRSAVVEYAREGVLAVDRSSKITLFNQEAARLMKSIGMNYNPIGRDIEEIFPELHFTQLMETGEKSLDQEYSLRGLVIVANIVPIYVNGNISGAVATFRDKTEIRQMAEQLTGARAYAEALRSQTHEFMNKLHVILGMVKMEIYEQLAEYVKQISYSFQTDLGFITARIKDPVIAGFIIGKISYAREKGAVLHFTEKSFVPKSKNDDWVQDLVTILGNLIDNSLEALKGCEEKKVEVEILPVNNKELSIIVSDTGMGMSKDTEGLIFDKGFSTKGEDRGFGLYLVQRATNKLNGNIFITSEIGRGTSIHVIIPFEEKE
ncbi:MAG: DcuS/MalK family sensor histidine kinase [Bacillus sp. (in: Bacteria)]|nr:DcuS/MalK family sensor histidine kinase [Bacillus sp. (in: firmicutes)]